MVDRTRLARSVLSNPHRRVEDAVRMALEEEGVDKKIARKAAPAFCEALREQAVGHLENAGPLIVVLARLLRDAGLSEEADTVLRARNQLEIALQVVHALYGEAEGVGGAEN
jgi:hypothetical protein